MKNRLICLLLCLVMVLSVVLTSCSKADDGELKGTITATASESAITLTMWVVAEEAVSEEVADAVSAKLNSISKAKFKTELIVNFLTQEEYRGKLAQTITAYENTAPTVTETTKATTAGTGTGEEVITDETRVNEHGLVEIVYPGAVENQVDIIYINGVDMFQEYLEKGWLAELDEELNGSSKKLKEYVANSLLAASMQDGVTYAIPNNNVIGEYTYMLLDKELMDKYCQQGYINRGLIDGFCNEYVYGFLDQIAEFEPDVLPVASTYDECMDLMAHYWSIDPDTYNMLDGFSAFGYYYTDLGELSRGSVVMGYQSLFENEKFANDFLALNRFRLDNYFGSEEESGKRAAVKFVQGDAVSVRQYEDRYYPVIVKYPTASVADIYDNMFGVYARSKSVSRSMEIITYLNTNVEFRNVLQYGVEDVHYTLVEDGDRTYVERDKYNRYIMDVYKTGNAFLAYHEEYMSADIWESGKNQNRNSLIEPLLDFDFAEYVKSTIEEDTRVTIDKKGYNLSYSSGYSKDVLTQDETLANWLAQCDAAGAGLYVFKNTQANGSNLTVNYYLYNTLTNGAVDFGVEQIPVEETYTDDEGDEVTEQVGVQLIAKYKNNATVAANGYALSMINLYTKTSYDYELTFDINGVATEAVETTVKGLLPFDTFNTNQYSISVYENLSKAAVRDNAILTNWMKACPEQMKSPMTYILSYAEPSATEGKTDYTFVVYRNGLELITDMDIVPTGNTGSLNLSFVFGDKGQKLDLDMEDGEIDPTYVLYYVRVTANSDVVVNSDVYYKNPSDLAPKKTSDEKVVRKEATEDPDYVIFGELDTELVKFLYDINQEILTMVDDCGTNYQAMKSLVKDLGLLLSTKDGVLFSQFTDAKVIDYIRRQAGTQDPQVFLNSMRKRIQNAVSIKVQEPEVDADTGAEILYENEPYVFYASPCAMYYSWLETYGFLPANTEK